MKKMQRRGKLDKDGRKKEDGNKKGNNVSGGSGNTEGSNNSNASKKDNSDNYEGKIFFLLLQYCAKLTLKFLILKKQLNINMSYYLQIPSHRMMHLVMMMNHSCLITWMRWIHRILWITI